MIGRTLTIFSTVCCVRSRQLRPVETDLNAECFGLMWPDLLSIRSCGGRSVKLFFAATNNIAKKAKQPLDTDFSADRGSRLSYGYILNLRLMPLGLANLTAAPGVCNSGERPRVQTVWLYSHQWLGLPVQRFSGRRHRLESSRSPAFAPRSARK